MVSEKKIQQLVIDRSQQDSPSKHPQLFIFSALLLVCCVIAVWLYSAAEVNAKRHQVNIELNEQPAPLESVDAIEQIQAQVNKRESIPSKMQSIDSVLDASGHVVARRIATVSSRVTGKLNKLNIEEGIEVKQSQILAELDDKQAQISYQLALADLAAQKARYQETVVLQQFAFQKAERREQLVKEALISVELSENSQLQTEQLAAQVNNRKALIELAKQKAELALYQLEQHKIRAPFDGVVISKNAQVGELISAGGNGGGTIRTGVGTIVDMNSLEIEVEVGESYINRVHAKQKVIATLDAYPDWHIDSEVIAVIPTADRQKASIKVRVKLLEIDQRVLPDMGVKVSFLANNIVAKL